MLMLLASPSAMLAKQGSTVLTHLRAPSTVLQAFIVRRALLPPPNVLRCTILLPVDPYVSFILSSHPPLFNVNLIQKCVPSPSFYLIIFGTCLALVVVGLIGWRIQVSRRTEARRQNQQLEISLLIPKPRDGPVYSGF